MNKRNQEFVESFSLTLPSAGKTLNYFVSLDKLLFQQHVKLLLER